MAKPELGVKRACPNCGAKYYDLNRDPIVCPKCGTVFEERHSPPSYRSARPQPVVEDEEVASTDEEETNEDVELVSLDEAEEGESSEVKGAPFDDEEDTAGIEDFEKDDLVGDDDGLMDEAEDEDDVDGIIDGAVENEDDER